MQDKQYIIEIRYNNDFACQIANWIIKSLHDSNIIVESGDTCKPENTFQSAFAKLKMP